jgi:hypothetical protein
VTVFFKKNRFSCQPIRGWRVLLNKGSLFTFTNGEHTMKTQIFAVAALTVFFWLGNACAQDWGDRYENRLDSRGDRIDQRLDAKGERINDRLDVRSERAEANGHEQRALQLDRQGDRIENRLDRRGDRVDNRLDRRGQRVDRRLDRRYN